MTHARFPARPPTTQGSTNADTAEVDAAERRIGAILSELEKDTDADVHDMGLEEVVDNDPSGRPVIKRAVDVQMEPRKKRHWST